MKYNMKLTIEAYHLIIFREIIESLATLSDHNIKFTIKAYS